MIPVTKPFLPPLEEYESLVKDIWQRQWLTNNGPLVNELELRIKDYLDVPHFLFLNNGTIALQMAIKALELKGEIITTPFSFIATTSSILWEGCKPTFVDIERDTMNIDPQKIREKITPETSAILATHVFGNPCKIDEIDAIAKEFNLKVIYDASHCFGTKYKGQSIFSYGDISTVSFHATKLFHTIEGGGVFTKDPALLKKLAYIRNFGFDGPERFALVGINGKNSEFHAAMGVTNINYIESILEKRKSSYLHYKDALQDRGVKFQKIEKDTVYNYSYFPIVLESEALLKKVEKYFNDNLIYPRRYFHPSLNNTSIVDYSECPISEDVASSILCLPLYHQLSSSEINFILRIFLRAITY